MPLVYSFPRCNQDIVNEYMKSVWCANNIQLDWLSWLQISKYFENNEYTYVMNKKPLDTSFKINLWITTQLSNGRLVPCRKCAPQTSRFTPGRSIPWYPDAQSFAHLDDVSVLYCPYINTEKGSALKSINMFNVSSVSSVILIRITEMLIRKIFKKSSCEYKWIQISQFCYIYFFNLRLFGAFVLQ